MPRCRKIWQAGHGWAWLGMAGHGWAWLGMVDMAIAPHSWLEWFVARKLVTMVGAQGSEIALNAEVEAAPTPISHQNLPHYMSNYMSNYILIMLINAKFMRNL